MEWSNKMLPRSRNPWLLFVSPAGEIHRFQGRSIPGIVAIAGHDFCKSGKWSGTTFRLEVAPGVRVFDGADGWETDRFTEGLSAVVRHRVDRWMDVANALGVRRATAQAFLREWLPREAAELDQVEADLAALEASAGGEAEHLVVTFGHPRNRQREAGFWKWPVVISVAGHEVGRLAPNPVSWGWSDPVITGPVKLLSVVKGGGTGGGSVELTLAVPEGSAARHGEPW